MGVDDDIRKLFRAAEAKLKELPDADLEEFSKSFEAFSEEFEAMIFKEEAILLMILLLKPSRRMIGFQLPKKVMPMAMQL